MLYVNVINQLEALRAKTGFLKEEGIQPHDYNLEENLPNFPIYLPCPVEFGLKTTTSIIT